MVVKCIKSFGYAFKGIYWLIKSENNAKFHLLSTIIVVAAALYLHISREHFLWIIFAIGFVWVAEAFNTAIEKLVDIVSPQQHPQAGKVKDIAAGAVLIAAMTALITGIIVFIPYLCNI